MEQSPKWDEITYLIYNILYEIHFVFKRKIVFENKSKTFSEHPFFFFNLVLRKIKDVYFNLLISKMMTLMNTSVDLIT